jgi:hypothetical protein
LEPWQQSLVLKRGDLRIDILAPTTNLNFEAVIITNANSTFQMKRESNLRQPKITEGSKKGKYSYMRALIYSVKEFPLFK